MRPECMIFTNVIRTFKLWEKVSFHVTTTWNHKQKRIIIELLEWHTRYKETQFPLFRLTAPNLSGVGN